MSGVELRTLIVLKEIRDLLKQVVDRPAFDPRAPINAYGESFTDAIQNSLVRGQKGIDTYGNS